MEDKTITNALISRLCVAASGQPSLLEESNFPDS